LVGTATVFTHPDPLGRGFGWVATRIRGFDVLMVVIEENDTHVWDHRCRPATVRPAAAGAGGPAQDRGAGRRHDPFRQPRRSEEHTSELQSHVNLVCRLLLEKKKKK